MNPESPQPTPRTRKYLPILLRVLLLTAGLAGSAALVIFWRIHSSNASEDHVLFAAMPTPLKGQRIMVISPHCDDEVLGAGGYISAAVRAGADVRVVMMTNGDGFGLAAAMHYKDPHVTPRLLRSFAYARQQETIAADGALGVPPNHITFLGFPDQGLAKLWTSNWDPDDPYDSPFTGASRNPYTNSLHPNESYCGRHVLEDLEEVLTQFQPDLVLTPHPNDDHPDHWATSSFVRAAISELTSRGEPWAARMQCQFFVVHHGDWPVPQGYHPAVNLAPPFSLAHTDTHWYEIGLGKGDEDAKLRAIRLYRSQEAVMARFLESFVRRTECFGVLPTASLAPASCSKPGEVVIELSPVGDTLLRTVESDANIEAITGQQVGDRVVFRVKMRASTSPGVSYSLYLQSINARNHGRQSWHATVHGSHVSTNIAHASAAVSGRELKVSIPTSSFRPSLQWFISAGTRLPYVQLDRAGWRQFQVSPCSI